MEPSTYTNQDIDMSLNAPSVEMRDDAYYFNGIFYDISEPSAPRPAVPNDRATTHEEQDPANQRDILNLEESDHRINELMTLLLSWQQEEVVDHLVENKVFVNVLKVIKRHHLGRLLQNFPFGTQVLFEHKLEEWRNSIGLPFDNDNVRCLSRSESPLSTSSISISSPTPPNSHGFVEDENSHVVMLSTILNETPRGTMIGEYYKKFGKFQDEQRASLITAIAQYFEERDIQMSLAISHRLEGEILETFPTEKLEYYRTTKRGKLYNKYCNIKSAFKTAVSKHVVPKKKLKTDEHRRIVQRVLVPEDDAESAVRCLKYDNLSVEEFENCWKACSNYRLYDIQNLGTFEIFEKWPYYKRPSGYRLVDIDFNVLYDNGQLLLEKWEEDSKKIIEFLSTDGHLKDKILKGMLNKVKSENVTQNGRDACILWSLHGYMVPTQKLVKRDTSGKVNIIKYTIKDSQESVVFCGQSHQQIEDHLQNLKKRKKSIQPFIMCVIGEDITNVQEIYVYFDDIKYPCTSFLRAIDICFKICCVFNLAFPKESIMFWTFIQAHFYEIKSSMTFPKVHILSESIKSND